MQLPALHADGALVVRHGTDEQVFDFNEESHIGTFFAAFYSCCEHEFSVGSGYRLYFIYDLIHVGQGPAPSPSLQREGMIEDIGKAANLWVKQWQGVGLERTDLKRYVVLQHKYPHENFDVKMLKGVDEQKVSVLCSSEKFEVFLVMI